jgi:Carboxypeptidase regulatory-like domain/TonB-dependent Receptor Plug Domain
MRYLLCTVALALLLTVRPSLGTAGTTGVLSGRIVDSSSNAALAGARVTVASPSESASATTDANGSYRFLSLAPDSYVVSVTQQGYEPVTQPGIAILADQTRTLNVSLVKNLQTIGQVRARTTTDLVKPGTTSDVYSVSGALATAANALSGPGSLGNSYSAIASVPGTVVQQGQMGWYQQLSIRGGDIDQVGYEFDGIPVNRVYDNAPETLLSSLGQQELQVYTGGTPATSDGQGLSGYVNQVVKTGTYPAFSTLVGSIGSPAYYHQASFEFGGASRNRLLTYYFGTAGQNQDFRYVNDANGAGDPRFFYPLYWPEGEYNIYDGTPGPVLFSPGQSYTIATPRRATP